MGDLAVELRTLAVDVATEAAQLLSDGLHRRRQVDTKSSPTDVVTEMDRAAEALLVDRILAERPDDGILGEEGASVASSSGVRWVLDPLDGTTNYLYRYPGWNVSVGVEVDGAGVAGAVVSPSTGDVFSAATGHGASLNDAALHRRDRHRGAAAPHAMLVGTGFNYDASVRSAQGTQVAALLPGVRDIRRGGAAALDLCHLAAGRLDAYYETGLAPWDRCAASVIATEAGYRVEHIDDHPLPGTLTVAGHPDTWDAWWAVLVDVGVVFA